MAYDHSRCLLAGGTNLAAHAEPVTSPTDRDGDRQDTPGVYFAKLLQEIWTEVMPSGAYWNQTRIVEDTRLAAFETHTSAYAFAIPGGAGTVRVEARLIFRRAFYDLMQQKGWEMPDILMEQAVVEVPVEE